MFKLRRFAVLAFMGWAALPAFGQVVLTPKNVDGLYKAGRECGVDGEARAAIEHDGCDLYRA